MRETCTSRMLRVGVALALSAVVLVPVAALAAQAAPKRAELAYFTTLPASPITGALDGTTPAQSWDVDLEAGDLLALTVTRTAGVATMTLTIENDFGDPIAGPAQMVAYTAGSAVHVTAIVGKTDTDAETGTFQLTWSVTMATKLEIASMRSTIPWGGEGTVRVLLHDSTGASINSSVKIERSYNKSAWSAFTTLSAPIGIASLDYSPTRRTYFRARFNGVPGLYAPALTGSVVLNPLALLTAPSSPSKVARNARFTVKSVVKPKHASGDRTIKFDCYRLENGDWVWHRTVAGVPSNRDATSSYVAASVTLPEAGNWRIRASAAEDSLHAKTASAYRYLSVNPTTISISADRSTATYGRSVKLTGRLRNMRGVALAYRPLIFEYSTDGLKWTYSRTCTTNKKGAATASVRPLKKTYYRFRYAGSTTQKTSTSARKLVLSRDILLSGYGNGYYKIYLVSGRALLGTMFEDYFLSVTIRDHHGKPVWYGSAYDFDNSLYTAVISIPSNGTYSFDVHSAKKWWIEIR